MRLQAFEIISFLKEPIIFQSLLLSFCVLLRIIVFLLSSMEAVYKETNVDVSL
jgi:hypothetical protein